MSFRKTDDTFRKLVIVGDNIATYTDDEGFTFMGLYQFLLNDNII